MKFDTIIIGGGLGGLVTGIELSRKGQKCLIVSSGQSALHFFSGSLELCGLGDEPLEAMKSLDSNHPYKKIGLDAVGKLTERVKPLFEEVGIKFKGSSDRNHCRITPIGVLKNTWLTMEEYASVQSPSSLEGKKLLVLNIEGFLDFHPNYIAAGLDKMGAISTVKEISMPELERLRHNPTEMRSTNIAKTLTGDTLGSLAAKINRYAKDVDAVMMPAIVGLTGCADVIKLKEMVNKPLHFLATLPPSVPGIRMQIMLKKHFQKIGGVYMLGDSVNGGTFEDGRLKAIQTVNHSDTLFEADNFVLASGSLFSKGLVSDIDGIREPIFDLDVDYAKERQQWYKKDMFEIQPYMSFGVATDDKLHAMKDGKPVENLYAVGSVLSGCFPIKEGSGAGIALLSSLYASDTILENCN